MYGSLPANYLISWQFIKIEIVNKQNSFTFEIISGRNVQHWRRKLLHVHWPFTCSVVQLKCNTNQETHVLNSIWFLWNDKISLYWCIMITLFFSLHYIKMYAFTLYLFLHYTCNGTSNIKIVTMKLAIKNSFRKHSATFV